MLLKFSFYRSWGNSTHKPSPHLNLSLKIVLYNHLKRNLSRCRPFVGIHLYFLYILNLMRSNWIHHSRCHINFRQFKFRTQRLNLKYNPYLSNNNQKRIFYNLQRCQSFYNLVDFPVLYSQAYFLRFLHFNHNYTNKGNYLDWFDFKLYNFNDPIKYNWIWFPIIQTFLYIPDIGKDWGPYKDSFQNLVYSYRQGNYWTHLHKCNIYQYYKDQAGCNFIEYVNYKNLLLNCLNKPRKHLFKHSSIYRIHMSQYRLADTNQNHSHLLLP